MYSLHTEHAQYNTTTNRLVVFFLKSFLNAVCQTTDNSDNRCTFSVQDVPPVPKTRSKYIVDNVPSSQPPHVPTGHSGLSLQLHQASVSTVGSPSSPTAPKHPIGAINTGPEKNQEAKPSFVSKILQKKFQKRTSSLQEFSIPDGSNKVEDAQWGIADEPNFGHQHFSCKDVTPRAMPQEYRPPPPFAPGYS